VGRTDVTITIQWILFPTCYERIRNVIVVKKSDNSTKEFKVDKDLTEYTIPNLESSVAYVIEMYSDYGNKSVVECHEITYIGCLKQGKVLIVILIRTDLQRINKVKR